MVSLYWTALPVDLEDLEAEALTVNASAEGSRCRIAESQSLSEQQTIMALARLDSDDISLPFFNACCLQALGAHIRLRSKSIRT
jgi:hypothetical protein